MIIRGIVIAGILVLAAGRAARAECVQLESSALAIELPAGRSAGWSIEPDVMREQGGLRPVDVIRHTDGRGTMDVGVIVYRDVMHACPLLGDSRSTSIFDRSRWSRTTVEQLPDLPAPVETGCLDLVTGTGEARRTQHVMVLALPQRALPEAVQADARAIVAAIASAAIEGRHRCPEPARSSSTLPGAPRAETSAVARAAPPPGPGPSKIPFSMGLYLDAARPDDPAALGGAETLMGAGVRARTLGAGSAELAAILGTTTDGGLRYEADVLLGYGGYLGATFQAAVLGGVGASGITGDRVPFSARLPLELVLGAHVSPTVHVETWARVAWVHADAREDGAPSFDAADELTLGAALALGRQGRLGSDRGGTAVYVAATYTEMMGTSVVGLAVGLGGVDRR